MSLPSHCAGDTTATSIAAAMNLHGGGVPALNPATAHARFGSRHARCRQSRPDSWSLISQERKRARSNGTRPGSTDRLWSCQQDLPNAPN